MPSAIKSFMFLETVNKNKPGKLHFKVIENTCHFLTNPNNAFWGKINQHTIKINKTGQGNSFYE
jgi:hypothetical protein